MSGKQTIKHCRFCKSDDVELIFEKDDIYIFKCHACSVVFLGSWLDSKAAEDLYSYYGSDKSSDFLSPVTKVHYKKLLRGFEIYRKNNAILDIGCGAGHFLSIASENGWSADGTEISDAAIELVKKKGQRVIKGDAAVLELGKEKYDVVTMFEVIEHADNPEGIMKKVSHMLRPGGVVYITTPNYNSITRRLLGDRWGIFHKEHNFYFTIKDLTLLLTRHGFVMKNTATKNLSLREVLNVFKTRGHLNNKAVFETQEHIRDLAERNIFFSILKGFINFILNISGTGETIYILAEKQIV